MATTHHEAGESAKRTRLIVDISPELRRRIRIAAAENDLSVKAYIERILDQAVPAQAQPYPPEPTVPQVPQVPQAVQELLRFQAQLQRAHPGVAYEDSVDILRRAREERDEQME